VNYLPTRVFERLKERPNYYSQASVKHFELGRATDLLYTYLTSVHRKQDAGKPQYVEDSILRPILTKYFDMDAVDKEYSLTPKNTEYVYIDFKKYLQPCNINPNYPKIDESYQMLYKWKLKTKLQPKILTIDELLPYLERSTSATFPYNTVYGTKGELLDDPSFRMSFVKFFHQYYHNEALSFWQATQKEEIRDTQRIQDMKVRSFLVGSVCLLIISHMLNYDQDQILAINWEKLRIGVGMSLFHGDYNRKMQHVKEFKAFFSDASKWDSRMIYYLARLECQTTNWFYGERSRYIKFSKLLGSWDEYRKKQNLPDFKVDTFWLRHIVTVDSQKSINVMPHGEVLLKTRGQNSGDGRTTPRNTNVHKAKEFETALNLIPEEWDPDQKFEFIQSHVFCDETGDDMFGPIKENEYFDCAKFAQKYKEVMEQCGWETEVSEPLPIQQCEYLSAKPVDVETPFGPKLMPLVNRLRIVSSLGNKVKDLSPSMSLQKLIAACIACFWDFEVFSTLEIVAEELISQYDNPNDTEFQKMKQTFYRFNAETIVKLYCGQFEGVDDECLNFFTNVVESYFGYNIKLVQPK